MITKRTRRAPQTNVNARTRSITANTSITSGVRNRNARPVVANSFVNLTAEQRAFARQLQANAKRQTAVMAATNTANIAARPDFLELLPLFVQKLILTDVFGSVAMRSRQQLIPYFKVVAENTKGETKKGDIFSTPFANRQGADPNFTSRIVKNEAVEGSTLAYVPVLPGSVSLAVTGADGTKNYFDNGAGAFVDGTGAEFAGAKINYATGLLEGVTGDIAATYQYDNETVGPDADGAYGAKMGKTYLQLDEINLVAKAHEVACYHSIYAAFAASQEYGANIADISKEAAFSELTAEINTAGFDALAKAAAYKPQFNWDASPILSGAVVPLEYLNMFKLKLGQAAASVYQATRLTRPNRLVVGSNVAEYMLMINGFQADNNSDTVGPYKLGTLDQFAVYVNPDYDPNLWVMSAKSEDLRRNSAIFGEYMPLTATDPIGLADMSVQTGMAAMYDLQIVNPETIVSGKILGAF